MQPQHPKIAYKKVRKMYSQVDINLSKLKASRACGWLFLCASRAAELARAAR